MITAQTQMTTAVYYRGLFLVNLAHLLLGLSKLLWDMLLSILQLILSKQYMKKRSLGGEEVVPQHSQQNSRISYMT
jgi:hypothetical protein